MADLEYKPLSDEYLGLLRELAQIGAATPIELAVKVARDPDEVRDTLKQLFTAGMTKVFTRKGYETEIYTLSDRGRRALRE